MLKLCQSSCDCAASAGKPGAVKDNSVKCEGQARAWETGPESQRGVRPLMVMFKLLDWFFHAFRLSVKKVINMLYCFSWTFFLI